MRYFLSLLFVLSGLAQAFEFVPEAAVKTGYGPTQEGWSMYYSGVCGERVAVQVNYQGRPKLATILPQVHSYSRESVKHILQRCPTATDMQVEVRGEAAKPPVIYLFSMKQSDDWVPSNQIWYQQLISKRTEQGFLPFELTDYIHGLLKLEDGVFEAHYGRTFANYMRGEQIQQHMMEGTDPPRVSHFTISGDWYEFGDKRQNKRCPASKDGYPYWGSFVFTFGPRASYGNLQKKACATEDGKGQGERLYLSNAESSNFKQEWGIEKVKAVGVLGELAASMKLQSKTHDPAAFAKSRQPLFENAQIRIFPRRENWCSRLELDAVYFIDNERRNDAFDGSYVNFLSGILWDLVNDHCGKPLVVGVDNYQDGDTERWDRMSFLLDRPNKSGFEPADEKYVQLTDHFQGESAKAHAADLDAHHLGTPCTDSPFCELPGGRYINAIYRSDIGTVQEIDQQHAAELEGYLDESTTALGMQTDNPISKLFKERLGDSAFIEDVTNKYMYAYAAWGRACYKPGAEEKTFRYTTPVIVETDPWGVTSRSGGDVYEASYTTNPEFFALRDRLGSHYGAQNSDDPFLRKTKALVFKGLVGMKETYACDSAQVQQFEFNLRQMTLAQLNGVKAENLQRHEHMAPVAPITPVAPVTSVTPQSVPKSEKTQTASPEHSLPQPVPHANPTVSGAVLETIPEATQPPVEAIKPKLTQAEVYAQRNAEMKILNDAFIEKVNALNERFKKDSNAATNDQARLTLMRAFQQEITALRDDNESKTREIKSRYQ